MADRWRTGAAALRDALVGSDPHQRVEWVAGQLSTQTLTTTRLAECWIHTGAVAAAVGLDQQQTDRLEHIVRLAWRTLPYAFRRDGCPSSTCLVAFEVTVPSGQRWHFVPDSEPVTIIERDAVDLRLIAVLPPRRGRHILARHRTRRGRGPRARADLRVRATSYRLGFSATRVEGARRAPPLRRS